MIRSRRLRRSQRQGIPFVMKFDSPLTREQADEVREKVKAAARRGDPLIVGPHVEVINLRRQP